MELTENFQLKCAVCRVYGTVKYMRIDSCISCALFFQRHSFYSPITFDCKSNCEIDGRDGTRGFCRPCRYAKCIAVGMRLENYANYQKN